MFARDDDVRDCDCTGELPARSPETKRGARAIAARINSSTAIAPSTQSATRTVALRSVRDVTVEGFATMARNDSSSEDTAFASAGKGDI